MKDWSDVRHDIAARVEAAGVATEARETVHCDDDCGAFMEPRTLDEYREALEHWMDHGYLSGCSHGA